MNIRPNMIAEKTVNQGSKIDRRDGFSVFLPSRSHSLRSDEEEGSSEPTASE